MRAARAYEVKHVRGGLLALPGRVDHVEVVEVDSGEVVLLWDLAPAEARHVVADLRESLRAMEAEEFISTWRSWEPGAGGS